MLSPNDDQDIRLNDFTLQENEAREKFSQLIDIANRFITAAHMEDEEYEQCVQFMQQLHKNSFMPAENKAPFIKEVLANQVFHQLVWDRCKQLPELAKHYVGLLYDGLCNASFTANEIYNILNFVPAFEKGNVGTRLRTALHQETMQCYLSILSMLMNKSIEAEKIGNLLTSKGHAGLNAAMYIGTMDADTNFKFLALLTRLLEHNFQNKTLDAILSITQKGLFQIKSPRTYLDALCDNKAFQLDNYSQDFLQSTAFEKLKSDGFYQEKYLASANKLKMEKQLMNDEQTLLSVDQVIDSHFPVQNKH